MANTRNSCHRFKKYWVIVQIFFAFSATIVKSIRWPNDWAEAHWLLSYNFGFIRRALPGSILTLFFIDKSGFSIAESIIISASLLFLVLFSLFIIWISYRIILRSSFSLSSILIVLVFLSSPFIVMSGHINGYFDNIILLLAILSILLVRDKRYWLSSIALSVGVLIHESILIIGLPSVIFFVFVQFVNVGGRDDTRKTPSQLIYNLLKISILPIFIYTLLSVTQYYFIDQGHLQEQLLNHLSSFSFIKENRPYIVSRTMTTSFIEYWKIQSPDFFQRITKPIHLRQIGLPLIYLYYYVWQIVQEYKKKYLLFFLLLTIAIMPLSLHTIAWDVSRIWTYPLVVTFLGIWSMCENKFIQFQTNRKIEYPLFIAILLSQIFFQVPLMDNSSERFLPVTRIILFMPSLILLLANFYLFDKPDTEK